MKIIVFDLPASESGALSILKDFYSYVLRASPEGIDWTFVVSTDALGAAPERNNVKVLRFPDVKRGWARRICFELFEAARVARDSGADVILSLQNATIIGTSLPQVVYVHQSLPYTGKHFSYFKRDECFLALYSDIFRPIIGASVWKAKAVVVQTEWFKEAIIRRHHVHPGKISVIPPSVYLKIPTSLIEHEPDHFFYPTTPFFYKNIELIVKAVNILRKAGLFPKVVLTIRGEENRYAYRIRSLVQASGLSDNFVFIGRVPREDMVTFFQKMTLLFPSRLESFGLPLLEARACEGRIIAADTPFAREILSGYQGVSFHGEADAAGLALAMRAVMEVSASSTYGSTKGGTVALEAEWGKVVALLIENAAVR